MPSVEQPKGKAEPERFTPDVVRQPKNRRSQLLVIAVLLVTVIGGLLAISGWVIGLVLLFGGFVALFAIAVWAFKNWDY
jgi:F0F1-type ATP synthase assembly protein I